MWPNVKETEDFVTFAEEILNEKLHFSCRVRSMLNPWILVIYLYLFKVVSIVFQKWKQKLLIVFSSILHTFRGSHPEVFFEKGFLKICSKFTGEHPYRSVNLLDIFRTPFPKNISGWMLLAVAQWCSIKAWGLQVFSCEFCEISKNTFP